MIPYFLLIGIPVIFSMFSIRKKNGETALIFHQNIQARENGILLPVFFMLLLLLLVLRAETVGRDLANYHIIFDSYATATWETVLSRLDEVAFRILNFVVRGNTDNYHIYLILVALITVLPLAYVYNQNRKHAYVQMILFVNMSTFIMLFSGLRQAMAISIGVLAFDCIKRGQKKRFLLLALLATLIHTSGFMVFFLYPLYFARFQRKHLLILIPIILMVYIFNSQIFGVLTAFYAVLYDRFEMQSATGAVGSLILFVIFAAFLYVITDEQRMDDEAFALRNMVVLAVIMQCFAPLHTLAMRMNYYFIIFIPMAFGKCLSIPDKRYADIARLGEVVLCIYFTFYFCYGTYVSYVTGYSALDTIPYLPFWAE